MNRRSLSLISALFLCGLILAPPVRAAASAVALFQEAMVKETGERDLEGAVDLYRQVVELAGSDWVLGSKARMRMAACYERLGMVPEAEQLYLQVVTDTASTPGEISELAKMSLERLQTRKAADAAKARWTMVVRQFQETRLSISAGLGEGRSGTRSLAEASLALRYRVSSSNRPLALFLEGGTLLPLGNNSQSTDTASLTLHYQMYLAAVAELPHGRQRTAVPEMGVGAALTSSEIRYSGGSPGIQASSIWSPRLSGGLHLFPDHRFSLLLQGAYTANPYPKSVALAPPAHTQTLDVPTSLWTISIKAQMKIGWTKLVVKAQE